MFNHRYDPLELHESLSFRLPNWAAWRSAQAQDEVEEEDVAEDVGKVEGEVEGE
jgi:hypothetical protein